MPTSDDIYAKLKKGQSLEGAGLDLVEGRLLIDGLNAPKPHPVETFSFKSYQFQRNEGVQIIKNAHWQGLHFRDCDLTDIGFMGVEMANCLFEKCKLKEIGFWESHLSDCSFIRCDLGKAALGGIDIDKLKPNSYKGITFISCNLRGSAHSCESYRSCVFSKCRLDGVDFMGAIFEDCVFRGKLNAVMFRVSNHSCPRVAKNRLSGCDFRGAQLVDCRFIDIDMDAAIFSADEDILILPKGPKDLSKWMDLLGGEIDEGKKWYLDYIKSSAGTPSILSRASLLRVFTLDELQMLMGIVGSDTGRVR